MYGRTLFGYFFLRTYIDPNVRRLNIVLVAEKKSIMVSFSGKLLGIFLYMIPWADSLAFGNHLFIKYPLLQIIQIPAIPIILIERSIPFGNLL